MSADLFRTPESSVTTTNSSANSAIAAVAATTNGTTLKKPNHLNLIISHNNQLPESTTTTPPTSRIPIASPGSFRRCQSLRLRGERGFQPRVNGKPPATLAPLSGSYPQHNGNALQVAASGYARPRHSTTESQQANGLKVPGVDNQTGNRVRSLSLSLSSPRLSSSTTRINPRTPPTSPDVAPHISHHQSQNHSHFNNQYHNHTNTNQLQHQTNNKLHAKSHTHINSNNQQLHVKQHHNLQHQSHGNLYDVVDDDLDSLNSYASIASTTSCDHPFVAHNGTTFSGRRMKYVVHCSAHAGQTGDEYLTPTQRAQKQIKRLKFLLQQAKQDIEQKDSDIFRLTKEVVELRVNKASLNSPEDRSNSSEAVTVRENATDDMKTPDSPTCTDFTDDAKTPFEKSVVDMQSSFADSGHFDDLNLTTSKDSVLVQTCDKAVLVRLGSDDEQRIVEMYERKLEDLIRAHGSETQDLKQKHNEKIDELLLRLSDVNIRYCQLVPNYDQARDKITELEKQLDDVNKQLQDQEEKNKQLYLQMYNKGVEAARLEQREQVMTLAQQSPNRVSVSDLLQQLQVTATELENMKDTEFMAEHVHAQSLLSAKEAVSLWVLGARKAMYRRLVELKNSKSEMDPEITLQFLKSAIYYFLTDKENHQGHLRAIQSILGFSPSEIGNIDKARTS